MAALSSSVAAVLCAIGEARTSLHWYATGAAASPGATCATSSLANLVAAGHPLSIEKVSNVSKQLKIMTLKILESSSSSSHRRHFSEIVDFKLMAVEPLEINFGCHRLWSYCPLSCQLPQTTSRLLSHLFCQTFRFSLKHCQHGVNILSAPDFKTLSKTSPSTGIIGGNASTG